MINRSEPLAQLLVLVGNLCNGTLDEHGMAALQQYLRTDGAACDLYIDYMALHCDLQWTDDSLRRVVRVESVIDSQVAAADPFRDRRRAGSRRFSSLARFAAAAVLVFGFVLAITWLFANSRPAPQDRGSVAALIDTQGAVWAVPAENPRSVLRNPSAGQQLPGGWLNLRSGTATLVFTSGAQVTLQGPAEFALNSPLRGYLRTGELTAYCPPSARGFTVGAPGCAVVDLGTEFRMRVDPGDRTRVYVKRGKVNLRIPGEADRPLHAGAGVAVAEGQVTALPPDPRWTVPSSSGTLQVLTSSAQPEGTFHPLADDLVNAGRPTLAYVTAVSPTTFAGQSMNYANNGATDYTGSVGNTSGSFGFHDNGTLTFTLNTALNPAGYDLSEIRVLSGFDGRRISHNFDVEVAPVGSDRFVPLTTVHTGDDPGAQTGRRLEIQTLIRRTFGESVAQKVGRVRFTFHNDHNSGPETVYREVDIAGVPHLEPRTGEIP